MKEKTKTINNWYELIEFVDSINPNKETIVLSGWINQLNEDRTYIEKLFFTTKDVNILKEKVTKNGTNKVVKKTVRKSKK